MGQGRALVWLGVLFLALPAFSFPLTPDEDRTPGELCTKKDPDFERYRYGERIAYCERNVSGSLKDFIYDYYHIPERCRHRYTIDHLIPLSIGGDNSTENLWPEHKLIKKTRQDLEFELFLSLRDGELTQDEAVDIIRDAKFDPEKPREGQAPCDQISSLIN